MTRTTQIKLCIIIMLTLMILMGVTVKAEEKDCIVCENITENDAMPQRYPEEIWDMSESEYLDLLLTVNGEAGTQGYIGQRAVTEVMANRVMNDEFKGETFHAVLSAKGQFDAWKSRHKNTVTQETINAVEDARLSDVSILSSYIVNAKAAGMIEKDVEAEDYVYFCTRKSYRKVGYKYMRNIITIGDHVFGTL